MRVRLDPRQWPGRVIPETDSEIDTAVEAVCLRASWADADRQSIRAVLVPWFAEEWSVDAVLKAVDHRPDGSWQGRPRGRDQEAHEFLRARLRAWSGSGGQRAKPPVPGVPFGQWWRVNRRNARLYEPRETAPLGQAGREAREESLARARAHLSDPVERSRAKAERWREALDSLLVPGKAVPTFEDSRRLLVDRVVPRTVCAHCGSGQVMIRRAA
ncbi:hypothetical protein ACFFQW_02815 [Umezawaea endophytica]|uniref:Uncharacterized protein n=1 Tax=Umezawaea endophytica TaxID=1654476 RepID=A0A9X2VSV8_9PSEU|nr:hypothetical protein [Umezawaea endophytica]MCS7482029.1 hypothetical protein [Umezawaea endophytica]